jgi:hypothetical protein
MHGTIDRQASPRERVAILIQALPDTVRIGPHDYAVRAWNALEGESARRFAQIDHLQLVISVSESHAAPSQLCDTFVHELLHGVWRHADLGEEAKEERSVTVFAGGLVALFRDNPWLPGWIAGACK